MAEPQLIAAPPGVRPRRTVIQRLYGAVTARMSRAGGYGRIAHARLRGVGIDHSSIVEPRVQFRFSASPAQPGAIRVAPNSRIGSGAIIDSFGGNIAIAEHCFIGPYTMIMGHGGVAIGRDTLIAAHCRILSSEHQITATDIAIRSVADIVKRTIIGEDCWLGAGVTITAGVTIGDSCVIGAGAVVTHDLPAGSVAVGVPARVIRMRDARSSIS